MMDGARVSYDLTELSRHGDLCILPQALTDAMMCHDGFVAGGGYAIVSQQSGLVDIEDRILTDLGLGIRRCAGSAPLTGEASDSVARLRIGLLYRILEMAHAHLSKRNSFGTKTTNHQLVRAAFSEIHIEATLLSTGLSMGYSYQTHVKLTELSHRADRLMGGHGFLLGKAHSISYLSDLYAGQCYDA